MAVPYKKSRAVKAVLGIETATSHGGIALYGNGVILGEVLLFNPRTHSEKLLPAVDTILKMSGFVPADLTAIAVSAGPGSFTGLRIGVAAAKGLAFSLKIPLYGISTLEVLAANAAWCGRPVCPVIDARRGEIFTALIEDDRGSPIVVREETVCRPEELAENIPPGTVFVGELPARLRSLLSGKKKGAWIAAPAHLNHPRAAVVAMRGEAMFSEEKPSEAATLVPFYLRPSDAESNLTLKKRWAMRGIPQGGGNKAPGA